LPRFGKFLNNPFSRVGINTLYSPLLRWKKEIIFKAKGTKIGDYLKDRMVCDYFFEDERMLFHKTRQTGRFTIARLRCQIRN